MAAIRAHNGAPLVEEVGAKAVGSEGNMAEVTTRRIHDPATGADGRRVLVDRVWPRGMRKEDAAIDLWLKDAAPSRELRQWFGHDPDKWPEFRRRYHAELDAKPEALQPLREFLERGERVTLLFAARDEQHNNAVALAEYLRNEHAP